jgi:hypothetical protein
MMIAITIIIIIVDEQQKHTEDAKPQISETRRWKRYINPSPPLFLHLFSTPLPQLGVEYD